MENSKRLSFLDRYLLGLPFVQARSIGLFVNGVSMMGAT